MNLQDGILYKYRDNLYIVRDVVENPMSSTAVRQAVQQVNLPTVSQGIFPPVLCQGRYELSLLLQGRSLKYMIPDGVIELIQEHGLYRG